MDELPFHLPALFTQVKFAPGILELPCDVLIPAALETQIHSGNAGNVKVIMTSKLCWLLSFMVFPPS